MAEEFIAIMEHLMNNPVLKVVGIVYIIFTAIVLFFSIAVFAFVMKQIAKNHKRHGRK